VWNQEGRLQGRSDVPLARHEAERPVLLPDELIGFRLLSSPLRRAAETARMLGLGEPVIEPRLIEMAWGAWEGRTLPQLRAALGPAMVAMEALGLDFHPPGGESPRMVQHRVQPLLAEIAVEGRSTLAVTHKGVIRAILALASGWDMRDDPPWRLSWSAVQLLHLASDGTPSIERLNLGPDHDPGSGVATR